MIITTPVIEDYIGDSLKISGPPAYKTKTVQYNLEEGDFVCQKAKKITDDVRPKWYK